MTDRHPLSRFAPALIVGSALALPAAGHLKAGDRYPGQMSDHQSFVFEAIKQRRTVRSYRSTPVPEDHLMQILEAAHFAPSAGNQQPWRFLVVRDRQKLDRLRQEALGWYIERFQISRDPAPEELDAMRERISAALEGALSAPVYIAVLVDSEAPYPDYIIQDGTLAAGYLMIAARALGYGTGFFTTFFPEERIKTFFDIPDRYRLICVTPIGIPSEWPDMPEKKALGELVFHESIW